LQHPNILQVFEIGEHEGKAFLALEFCAGGSLKDVLGGTPLLAAQAAALLETLARAMHAAHQAGVIHRDLKPANVLLAGAADVLAGPSSCSGDARQRLPVLTPKIADFGLAKMDERGHTVTGEVFGTPSYMAPEQARGSTREIGPLADEYALGAILYELLTGRPPFRSANPPEIRLPSGRGHQLVLWRLPGPAAALCLVHEECRRPDVASGAEEAQRPGAVRHARQRLDLVPGKRRSLRAGQERKSGEG
jgi:serine/threonine protein kinase